MNDRILRFSMRVRDTDDKMAIILTVETGIRKEDVELFGVNADHETAIEALTAALRGILGAVSRGESIT